MGIAGLRMPVWFTGEEAMYMSERGHESCMRDPIPNGHIRAMYELGHPGRSRGTTH
ncbi:hypothetical protein FOMPIDRAFT_1024632 [Fomitopsis schrenkii]|uniref:Uncharacterized protein n=1 Tax=Fomitopsis schrenkii TaxID=2126942 RepID=S8DZR8_FOMSC|nr:hypothetical protein FOMPIDRAFT_1024632 [Fomitopsis schrenkii]